MTDPNLAGFMEHLGPWVIPVVTYAFGYATKSGVNQKTQDDLGENVKSLQAQSVENTRSILTHNVLLDGHVGALDEIRVEMKETNRLLGRLIERAGISDTQTFRTLR